MSKSNEKKEEEVDPMTVLTDDQLRRYREVFASFDPPGEGLIEATAVGTAMRGLGLSPSEEELRKLMLKIVPTNGKLDFRGA
jgi:Ca2+-binding EF-hand superfamily protein